MDFLLTDGLRPFSMLAGFIALLLVMEIGLLLVGTSSNIEIDAEVGDAGSAWEVEAAAVQDAGLSADEIVMLDLAAPDRQGAVPAGPSPVRRLMRLVGIGNGPLLVTLTCMAAGVSALGYFLQLLLQGLAGAMLPGWIAVVILLVPGLLLGGRLAALAARVVPAHESHAISAQTYHGRRGHVVIGTARRGEPAQVRWRDTYGTTHSLMAEPLRDEESLAQGTEVLIVKTRERQPRIVATGTD